MAKALYLGASASNLKEPITDDYEIQNSEMVTTEALAGYEDAEFSLDHPDLAGETRVRRVNRSGWALPRLRRPPLPTAAALRIDLPRLPRGNRLRWLRKRFAGSNWQVTSDAPLSWVAQLYEFTQNTTFHGIRYVFDYDNVLIRRILWLVFIVGMGYYFYGFAANNIRKLILNPTSDSREIKYRTSMAFPAVTICNHNSFRTSVAAEEGLYTSLGELFGNASAIRPAAVQNLRVDNFTASMEGLAHQRSDLVYRCEWQGKACNESAFRTLVTDQGVCYTFNWDASDPLITENAGPLYGLSLTLNVEQYEYMAGPLNTAGVRVIIHKQSEVIDVTQNGIDVPPSFMASVGLSETEISNDIASEEVEEDKLRYWSDMDFSKTSCDMECESDFIEEVCRCHRIQVPVHEGIFENQTLPPCNLYDKYRCVDQKIARYKSHNSPVDFNCAVPGGVCPQSSKSISTYTPVLSYALLSSYNADEILKESGEVGAQIERVRDHFLNAREYKARFNNDDILSDQAAFQELDNLYVELERDFIAPDSGVLADLSLFLLNISCFDNARRIVDQYSEYVDSAIGDLERMEIFAYSRSLFLYSYRGALESMGVDHDNFRAMLDFELAQADPQGVEALVEEVNRFRISGMGTVSQMATDIDAAVQSIEAYVGDNVYLRNISSFNANVEALPSFRNGILACLSGLNRSLDVGAGRLGGELASGRLSRNSWPPPSPSHPLSKATCALLVGGAMVVCVPGLGSVFGPWASLRARCEELLVASSALDRTTWGAALEAQMRTIHAAAGDQFADFQTLVSRVTEPDFVTFTAARDVRAELQSFQRSYITQEMTKLDLAERITDQAFGDKIEYYLNFLSSVDDFLFRADGAITEYMNQFGDLNEKIPEVVRELFRRNQPVEFRLYFEHNLFTTTEVAHCVQNRTEERLGELRKVAPFAPATPFTATWAQVLSSNRRRYQSQWAALRARLRLYRNAATLDSDFVLTNFAEIRIFFTDLRLETIVKRSSYSLSRLVAELGSLLGLFFGGSFLTIGELIDVFLYTSVKKWRHERHSYLQEHQIQRPSHYLTSKLF